MHLLFVGSSRRYLSMLTLVAFVLLVSGLLSYEVQRSNIQIQFGENVSVEVKDKVEALARGQVPKADVNEDELKTRRAYATQRFGSADSDRGRFYIYMGKPDEVETKNTPPRRETWMYKKLQFSVTFSDLKPIAANRPPGVSQARWIPLSETSGIALRDSWPASRPGKPIARGTLMANLDGIWTRVALDSEVEIMPVGR